jgi:hypothetical protein
LKRDSTCINAALRLREICSKHLDVDSDSDTEDEPQAGIQPEPEGEGESEDADEKDEESSVRMNKYIKFVLVYRFKVVKCHLVTFLKQILLIFWEVSVVNI